MKDRATTTSLAKPTFRLLTPCRNPDPRFARDNLARVNMGSEHHSSESAAGKIPYSDSSGAIFSMYLDKAQKVDDDKAENWRRSAESILTFTGLFSGTVASFILSSYQSLQPDPNTATQLLLAQISQQLSPSNNTDIPSPSVILDQSSFRPSHSAVAINVIWFLSLTLSLTCALGATLMHQWTLRYLQITRRNSAPHTRACIRGYLARGVDRSRFSVLVEALPTLLLASIFLFFAGLVIFIFHINHTVAFFTISVVAFCFLAYITLTFLPILFHDSPYLTPLSPFVWYCFFYRLAKVVTFADIWGTLRTVGIGVAKFPRRVFSGKMTEKMVTALETSAKAQSMEVYRDALNWTADNLDEDHEFEEFARGLPGLYRSQALQSQNISTGRLLALLRGPRNFHPQLSWSIIRLARRMSTGDLKEPARSKRIKACLRALFHIPGAIHDALATYAVAESYCLEILPVINSVQSMNMSIFLSDAANQDTIALPARCVTATIAAFAITRPINLVLWSFPREIPYIGDGDASFPLLSTRLRITENLNEYLQAEGGDTARLANLTVFLQETMQSLRNMDQLLDEDVHSGLTYAGIKDQRALVLDTRTSKKYTSGRQSTRKPLLSCIHPRRPARPRQADARDPDPRST
ncbi:hypothetical protein BC834DRAFT_544275 [Gloeopeniophorella convolvens]|nr:hypothetical protein BC834DRAFT_544275 [Gloeopeniophorella convolvens]